MNVKETTAARPKILYTDDEKDFLALFTLSFGKCFDIVSASSGHDAIKMLASHDFDAIITDYELGDITGIELLKHVKKFHPDLPVIFYTGRGNESITREAFISGASDYFTKNGDILAHREKILNSVSQAIELVKAEQALRQDQKKYRFVFDSSMEIHLLLDMNMRIIDVNQPALDITNLKREEVIGREILDFIEDDGKEQAMEVFTSEKEGIYTPSLIFRIMTPAGVKKILTREGSVILRDEKNNPVSMLISGFDITELDNIQETLKKQEELLRAITFGARIAIVIMDQNGKITYWNEESARQFHYSISEALGKPFHTVILPKRYHAPYRIEFEAFKKTEQKVFTGKTIAMTAVDKNGVEFPMELSLSSVRLENNWHAVGVIRDMSRQRQAEDAVRDSREQFSSLVECVEDAIFTVSPEGYFMSANPAFERMTGWLECFINGQSFLPYIHREDRVKAVRAFEKAAEGEQVGSQELRIKLREGGYKIGEIKLTPLIQSGKIAGVVGVGHDITERKRAEQDLMNINRELSDFAHTITHDLKGQLTIIQGYLNLINDNQTLFDTYFDRITVKNRHLISFVDNILKLSRAGKVIGEKKTIALDFLIRSAYETEKVDSTPSILEVHHPLPKIKGDPERISQMFTNLIQNSFRHRDPAKDTLVITVKAIPDEHDLHLCFADNGAGISSEHIDRIFNAGFTGDRNKGTGFGLAIVKKIVTAHDGEIRAESEGENQGVTFHIKLPCVH